MRAEMGKRGTDAILRFVGYIKMQPDDFLALPARLFGFTISLAGLRMSMKTAAYRRFGSLHQRQS